MEYVHEFFSRLIWCEPTDVDNFVVLIHIGDRHRHVVIASNDLEGR